MAASTGPDLAAALRISAAAKSCHSTRKEVLGLTQKRTIHFRTQTNLLVLTIAVPLIVIVLLFNIYTVQRASQQIYESSMSTVTLYQNSLESDLRSVESLLVTLASDTSFEQLRYPNSSYRLYSNIYHVQDKFQNMMNTYGIIGSVHFCSDANDIFRSKYRGTYDYETKLALTDSLKELLREPENMTGRGWFYLGGAGRDFLLRIIGRDGLYLICAAAPENFSVPQELYEPQRQTGEFLVYTKEGGTPVMMKEQLSGGIPYDTDKITSYKAENGETFWVSGAYSAYSKTALLYFQRYEGVLGHLDAVQLTLLLLSIFLSLLLPVVLVVLHQKNIHPMTTLISTMKQLRAGQLDAKMDEGYTVTEYNQLSVTFNELMEQIRNLKIDSYEKELSEQKTRLLLLQSQIRPHFYLNCMKNIYAMAQQHQYEDIQSMVLYLSQYLRHLFHDGSSLVTLGQELKSVESYVELQMLSSSSPARCSVQVPEPLRGIPIPPLSILTFVENSLKHGSKPCQLLTIRIKAVLLRDENKNETYLNLTVTDDGTGFSPEVLESLNSPDMPVEEGHIGIANVRSRLNLIYQNKSSVVFQNLKEGSSIDVYVPADLPEQET